MLSTPTMKKIWKLMKLGKRMRELCGGCANEPNVKFGFGMDEGCFDLEFRCNNFDYDTEFELSNASEKDINKVLDKAIKRAEKRMKEELKEQEKASKMTMTDVELDREF